MSKLRAYDLRTAPLDRTPVLLEASAGTGKTYTLIGILLRLLLADRIQRITEVLVVTFTVAATEELKHRLRQGLLRTLRALQHGDEDPFFADLARPAKAEPKLRQALDDLDQVAITTIHGFCKRVLDETAFSSGQPFVFSLVADPGERLHRAAADALRIAYAAPDGLLGPLLEHHGFTPEQLLRDYQVWQLKATAANLPSPDADLDSCLDAVAAALGLACRSLDEATKAHLQSVVWKQDKAPLGSNLALGLRQLAAAVQGPPALALLPLLQFTPAALREAANKRHKPSFDLPFYQHNEALAAAVAASRVPLRNHLLQRLQQRLASRDGQERVLTFDELLQRTSELLADPRRGPVLRQQLRQRYRAALIDEFQDTDARQYGIFASLFADRLLYLIGDPKQSIYAFRGADLGAYLHARQQATEQHTLTTNYRSAARLVAAVGQLFRAPDAFVHPELAMPPVAAAATAEELLLTGDSGAPLRFRCLPPPPDGNTWSRSEAEARILDDVVAEVLRLLQQPVYLDGRRLGPGDIAVLVRTNRQAELVQSALASAGVAAALRGAGDVFATTASSEFQLLLQAVLRPQDRALVRAAASTRLGGRTAAAIAALASDPTAEEQLLQRFAEWRHLWRNHGSIVMLTAVLREWDVETRLLQQRDGERQLTNYQHLIELLHKHEHATRCSPEALLDFLSRAEIRSEAASPEERELRLASDGEALQLATMHTSKGLEYEVVFCPFLWTWLRLPDAAIVPGKKGRPELHFDLAADDPRLHAPAVEQLAEELRLAYVALTRAKRRCYVHWGPIRSRQETAMQSALGWLLASHRATPSDDSTWLFDWQRAIANEVTQCWSQLQQLQALDPLGIEAEQIEVAAAPVVPRAAIAPAAPTAGTGSYRRLPPPPPMLRQHSYSSLVAEAPSPLDPGESPSETSDLPQQEDPLPATGIFAFARGATAGSCLHQILEQVQLDRLDAADEQIVSTALATAGLARAEAHAAPLDATATVMTMLRNLAAARLPVTAEPLLPLLSATAAIEWQFTLPLPGGSTAALAQLFAASDSPVARSYAPRLLQLPERRLRGYLVGYVDRIACWQGRYFVVDWKSNHLGNTAEAYHDAALWQAMHEHDYVLQYHLYILALHRQLRVRLPGYAPERHLGPVLYPFLRGLTAGHSQGIAQDQVPVQLLLALDAWAAGGKA